MGKIREKEDSYEINVQVNLEEGLHGRPSTGIVALLREYPNEALVKRDIPGEDDEYRDAKSVYELIMMGASLETPLIFKLIKNPSLVTTEDIETIAGKLEELLTEEV